MTTFRAATRRPLALALALAAAAIASAPAHAANYTYHGDLMDGDAPAQGAYDLRVRSFAHPGATKALAEPTELPAVVLRDGRFSVDLDVPEDPDGTTWVEVAVRRSGSDDTYDVLGTPQPIAKANSTCPGAWALDGNSGVPAGSFLGTVDAAAILDLHASGRRVARFDSVTDPGFIDAPRIALGSSANQATAGGATVSGGGGTHDGDTSSPSATPDSANIASGKMSTVSGGRGGRASGVASTVSGGDRGTASAYASTVGGGYYNTAGEGSSTVAGGSYNNAAASASTVGGGTSNYASGKYSVIAGGTGSTAEGNRSAVGGGTGSRAIGDHSVVVGGEANIAFGDHSVVSGGSDNCAGGLGSWASGMHAKVRRPAGAARKGDTEDACSDPALRHADGDQGTFVWADSQAPDFVSSGDNQFLIRAAGGVGINTATFGNAVDLRMSELMIRNPDPGGNVDLTLINQTNRGYGFAVVPGAAGAAGDFYISETDARTASVGFYQRFRIDAAGTTFVQGGAVGNLSDARLKKNIAAIEHPLDTLLALQGQTFEYIDPAASMNTPGMRMGFVAQQVQQAIPSWVAPTGDDGYLAVTPIGFEALVVEAIRDLKLEHELRIEAIERDSDDRLAALTQQNAALQASLDAVLARLSRIESATGARP